MAAEDPREIAGYTLRGRLGAGGMGVVYLSYTPGGQPVALKVIRREYAEDVEFRRRFTREVNAARRVQGAYTTPVLDSDTEGAQPWLASAYVPGPSLAHAVRTHGALPTGTVLSLVAGTAEALQSIHRADVVHRDLKPTNILLAADGPRVIDFGIAHATDATALTGTDVRLGTPAYMAPEQVTRHTEAGPAVDVFALGLIAYFAATEGHPFGEGAGYALLYRIVSEEPDLSGCPPQLHELISRCLAKEAAARPTPAEVIRLCHASGEGVSLERTDGWWLPSPVAEDVRRTGVTGGDSASGPAGPEAQDPTPTSATAHPASPPGTQPPPPGVPGPHHGFGATPPSDPHQAPTSTAPLGTPPPGTPPPTATPTDGTPNTPGTPGGSATWPTGTGGSTPTAHLTAPGTPTRRLTNPSDTAAPSGPGGTGGGRRDASGQGGRGRGRVLIAVSAALAAVLAGGGMWFAATQFQDNPPGASDPVDRPKEEDGWRLTADDEPLVISAPTKEGDAFASCASAPSTFVDLETLKVTTESNHGNHIADSQSLEYMNCGKGGSAPGSGFKLLDGKGIMGEVDRRDVTPGECRTTARSANIPNPVSIKQIQRGKTLTKDMGLCVETARKRVVLLWIERADKHPDNHNLRTYLVKATQWARKGS
ncbi:serine/threonine-protein kinase [Streptomyces sp. AJS327]|uniref:serine/threonine-protein kinase n=1 Tax=Streptomyces sp. AJS327 TaxID=2545265 RepID=UPI002155E7E0